MEVRVKRFLWVVLMLFLCLKLFLKKLLVIWRIKSNQIGNEMVEEIESNLLIEMELSNVSWVWLKKFSSQWFEMIKFVVWDYVLRTEVLAGLSIGKNLGLIVRGLQVGSALFTQE